MQGLPQLALPPDPGFNGLSGRPSGRLNLAEAGMAVLGTTNTNALEGMVHMHALICLPFRQALFQGCHIFGFV
jgi:hypothetical protein